jgi:hypothetical protein
VQTAHNTSNGGIVYLYFSVPSGTSYINMTLEMSGDFNYSNEYVTISANNNLIGSNVRTGYQGSTLNIPNGWSEKSISSSNWSAGSSLTILLNASSYVSGTECGGQNYLVTLTYF